MSNTVFSDDEKILTELQNLEAGERILKNEITSTMMKDLNRTVIALIKVNGIKQRKAELKKVIDDTLRPQVVGGRFIHEPVIEFVAQLKLFLEERIEELEVEKKGLE